ncbi:MAG: hypothetical protein WAX89_01650 [Alphaproteobacteria bacterium]
MVTHQRSAFAALAKHHQEQHDKTSSHTFVWIVSAAIPQLPNFYMGLENLNASLTHESAEHALTTIVDIEKNGMAIAQNRGEQFSKTHLAQAISATAKTMEWKPPFAVALRNRIRENIGLKAHPTTKHQEIQRRAALSKETYLAGVTAAQEAASVIGQNIQADPSRLAMLNDIIALTDAQLVRQEQPAQAVLEPADIRF